VGIVSVSHSKKKLASVTLRFNEALASSSAVDPSAYVLLAGVKKLRKTVYTKPLKIGSIVYNNGANTVTLVLAKPLKGVVELRVQGAMTAANGASGSVAFTTVVR
jgi:hypothetical protein